MEKDIVSILTTLNCVSTGLPIRKIVSLFEKRYFQYDKIDSRKEIVPKQSKIDQKSIAEIFTVQDGKLLYFRRKWFQCKNELIEF